MSIAAAAVKLAPSTTIVDTNPSTIALAPRRWRDTRWVGQVSGQATTPDVLAGAWVSPEARRAVNRAYAAACADLAQATLGGLPLHSAEWDHWFAALRTTARELSPALAGAHVVRRALHHGSRLEGKDAPWAHRLRRGFAALLAASLPEPVPALIGEDLATFRANDAAWLAQHPLVPRDETSAPASCRVLPVELAPPQLQADAGSETVRWPTATLRPNPLNPRGSLDPTGIEELAASIVAHADQGGILQPLLVTPDGTVVAGHRRLAAARRVGLAEVPVLVRALTPAHQLELLLVENLQRQELSPLELSGIASGTTNSRVLFSEGASAVAFSRRAPDW